MEAEQRYSAFLLTSLRSTDGVSTRAGFTLNKCDNAEVHCQILNGAPKVPQDDPWQHGSHFVASPFCQNIESRWENGPQEEATIVDHPICFLSWKISIIERAAVKKINKIKIRVSRSRPFPSVSDVTPLSEKASALGWDEFMNLKGMLFVTSLILIAETFPSRIQSCRTSNERRLEPFFGKYEYREIRLK